MNSSTYPQELVIGGWHVQASAGGIARDGDFRRLEPKVMDLLMLLASHPGKVFSHEEIRAALWAEVIVGEDALPRCVSKLRRALDDDAQEARFIQTVPKRGYRLLATEPVAAKRNRLPRSRRWPAAVLSLAIVAVSVFAWQWFAADGAMPANASRPGHDLVEQGLVYYSRYTRQDNESAIELFERALAIDPDNPQALSALANALGQRALRWPDEQSAPPPKHSTLTRALREGRLTLPNARLNLDAARAFAERSVRVAPDSAASYKALGLVVSAQGDIDAAIEAYEHALKLDPDAWGAMINLAELYGYKGDDERSLALLERTYELQPNYAELGVLIGSLYEEAGNLQEARLRYLNVLGYAPFHRDATISLAGIEARTGYRGEAARRCARLIERTGPFQPCETFLERHAQEGLEKE